MKKYFFLFILLCPLSAISWTAYIYDDNKDVFTLYPDSLWSAKNLPLAGEDEFRPGTIGYIPTKLGYLEDEWYMWFDENNDVVVFKAFTQVPICALVTTEFPNGLLGKDEYNNLISGFDYKATFKIDRAIKGKIRQKFMEKALGQTAVDNCIADNVNQFRYYFKDGYLIDAESYDGLVGYAREFKII